MKYFSDRIKGVSVKEDGIRLYQKHGMNASEYGTIRFTHVKSGCLLTFHRGGYGRLHRKEYERVSRQWGGYSAMRSYQTRPDHRTGTIVTFVEDNLVIETYEK